jgi:hypothetical protein
MIGKEKNKKCRIEKRDKLYNSRIFFSIFFLIAFLFNIKSQNLTDTLSLDSATNILQVKPHSNDSSNISVQTGVIPASSDTVPYTNYVRPRRAAILSAILPGLGQAYNGNYWKIPIIYSLFATMYFIGEDNNNRYLLFKRAYKGDTIEAINPKYYTPDKIKEYKNYYKRNRDLDIILAIGVYLLNILDANVDAHLMDFDISDDLSLKINPDYNLLYGFKNNINNSGFGIKFVLSF